MNMPLVLLNRRRRGGFNPVSLFSAGQQGFWLQPSDLTTMFQDRAGTTPVTTPGQTVGKRLDKSGRGNHAVAPTDAARPTYGIEPKTGRRNLLTRTEEFGDAVWTKFNVTLTENAAVAPNGTMTAESMIPNTTGSVAHGINERPADLATVIPAGAYTVSVYAKSNGYNWFRLRSFDGTSDKDVWFNLSTGQVGTTSAGATPSITSLGSGWYRCSIQLTASTNIPLRYSSQFLASPADNTIFFAGDGTSGILLWGAQLELGSTATAHQRVGTAFDVTEAGVPTVHYVQYDGTDDSFSTSSIDFSATDKMSVFAGVRKIADTNSGVIVDNITGSTDGQFQLLSGFSVAGRYAFVSKGSVQIVVEGSGYTSPITNVLTGLGDISGDSTILRINGTQVAQSTSDQGTGNFGNYPLFIGRRNNTSLPFNGRDYGIIIVGKTASATEITNTESYLAANTSGVSI